MPRDADGRVLRWIPGMDPCNQCGKNHLHRDCPDSKTGNSLEGLSAAQQAEVAKQISAYLQGSLNLDASDDTAAGVCELEETKSDSSHDWCALTTSSRPGLALPTAPQLTPSLTPARQILSTGRGSGALGGPGRGPGVSVNGTGLRVTTDDSIKFND